MCYLSSDFAPIASQPTLYAQGGPSARLRGNATEKSVTDVEIAATLTTGGRGAIAGNIVISPETNIGTARGRDAMNEMARSPTAAVEDIVVIVSEIETAKTVTEKEDANATTTRTLRLKSAQRGENPTRILRTRKAAPEDRVLAHPTETVLPTEDTEVGLLSIRETNSMIHPDIEGIGITVVVRVGTLLGMMMNSRNVVTEPEVLYPLLGVWHAKRGVYLY